MLDRIEARFIKTTRSFRRSIAYAKVIGYIRKLDPRSKKYLFIGYAPNGYRLWDKTSRKVILRGDAVFTEIEKLKL